MRYTIPMLLAALGGIFAGWERRLRLCCGVIRQRNARIWNTGTHTAGTIITHDVYPGAGAGNPVEEIRKEER